MAADATGMGVRVKFCGLTVPEQAEHCAREGAWAVGVIFAAESPRRVSGPAHAAEVLAGVPEGTARVGVFVDAPTAELVRAAEACPLTHLQVHGRVDVAEVRAETGLPVILAVPFGGPAAVARAGEAGADLVLFDAAVPGRHGGTGARLDWGALAAHRPPYGFGLAGGLVPENVAEAVRAVRPGFVDVASGVESAPGLKDPARVRAFMEAVALA
jgi:phosphoribosylanthranilate isomerase